MGNPPFSEDLLIEVICKFAVIEAKCEEWLPLRLVNRLFRQKIIFAIFVLRSGAKRYRRPCSRDDRGALWLTDRFARLHDSWWLQGLLVRPDIDAFGKSSSTKREAVDQSWWRKLVDGGAHLLTNYIEETGSNILDSIHLTGFIGILSPTISVAFQRAKESICDAFACLLAGDNVHDQFHLDYLEPMYLFDTGCLPCERSFEWTSVDIFHLVACFVGNLPAVQHSLNLLEQVQRDPADSTRVRIAGIYAAISRNNQETVSYLLSSGLKLCNDTWACALQAAALVGNLSVLQFLLRSEFRFQKDPLWLNSAMICAAEFPDTTVRIEMSRLLFAYAGDVGADFRTEILTAACRSNDVLFAKWIAETGPIRFDSDNSSRFVLPYRHPMMIAVTYGSTEMVRFLLRSNFEAVELHDGFIKEIAFCYAQKVQHFDIFMELVPHQKRYNPEEIMWCAAQIEHAVEAVDKMLGPVDLDSSRSERIGDTLGSSMIQRAIEWRNMANLDWLVSRKCRCREIVTLHLTDRRPIYRAKDCFDDLQRMEGLLKAHGHPGIKLKCWYQCKNPVNLSEILGLRTPWQYNCLCNQIERRT